MQGLFFILIIIFNFAMVLLEKFFILLIFSIALTPLFMAIYFELWIIFAIAYGPMIIGFLLLKYNK